MIEYLIILLTAVVIGLIFALLLPPIFAIAIRFRDSKVAEYVNSYWDYWIEWGEK